MQFVERGAIALDDPITKYLPTLRISGAPAPRAITVRRLLSHNSGIDGDFFIETGRNADATQRYVERASEIPMIAPPGTLPSYCNAGYVILGRLIEVVSGQTFADSLRVAILDPLASKNACEDPENAILFRIATGHDIAAGGSVVQTNPPFMARALEAAGSRLCMSADALADYAAAHLDNGRMRSGRRILEANSALAMQHTAAWQAEEAQSASAFGLGWITFPGWDPFAFGHDGTTNGQSAFLRIVPELRLVVTMLTNGGATTAPAEAFDALMRRLTRGALAIPQRPQPHASAVVDVARLAGSYESVAQRIEIVPGEGGLVARIISPAPGGTSNQMLETTLEPIDGKRFLAKVTGRDAKRLLCFVGDDRKHARYLAQGYEGCRLHRYVGPTSA
jgi:CubicO group peptidase (beta-lactamase class C family)